MRLNFFVGTPTVAAATCGCRVIRGGEAESASDHHSVVADLELTVA